MEKCLHLIAEGKSTHTAHDAQHVVVGGIYAHRGGRGGANSVVAHRQEQRGVINTGQVAGAAGLVLLGLESERVHVDTNSGDVGVVLVGLHLVEVATLAHREAVVAVQLDQSRHHRVVARHALHASYTVARLQHAAVPPVRVVERLLALPGVDDGVIARYEAVALDHPDELLARVVKVQLDLVGRGGDGLTARELQNLDQVLVGYLGELAALIRVQVDVIDVQRGSYQTSVGHTVADDVGVGGGLRGPVPAQVAQVVELQIDAHLVVLQSNQRQSQTRVAVKPELEGDVQRVLRGALLDLVRRVGGTGATVLVAVLTTLDQHINQLGHVTYHLGVASLLSSLLGQLVPDVQPVTVLLVNALTTDLNLHVLDQVVARPVEPAELGTRAVAGLESYLGQSGLEVHAVDQVTVALDRACHLLAEVRGTIERILNGLHGEVRVAAVHHLEERNLGVTRQVYVLSTVGYELHKATTCHLCLYPCVTK
jgi:hypothetical protein